MKNSPDSFRRLAFAVLAPAVLALDIASAANNDVWTGNTDNTWNNSANWNPVALPLASDLLFFGANAGTGGATLNDNLAAGTSFGGITFSNDAVAYTLTNNPIGLAGGITNNSLVNYQTIKLVITNNAGITINDAGGGTAISNSIFGAGGVTNAGGGTLTLGGSQNGNTFTGGVTINNGIVRVFQPSSDGNAYLGAGNVTVNNGGTLLGLNGDAFGFAGHPCPTNIFINAGGTVSNVTGGTLTLPNLIFTGGTITTSNGDAGGSGNAYVFNGNGTTMLVSSLASSTTATMAANGTGGYKVNKPTTFNIASGSAPGGVDMLVSAVLTSTSAKPITKIGNGRLVLSGVNTWNSVLTNNAGVVALTGSATLPASQILVTNGATFDVSGLSSAFTLASGKILAGSGVITGAVVAAASSTIDAGFYGGRIFGFSNDLSLNGMTNKFVLAGTTNGPNSKIVVGGNLTVAGANTILISGFTSLKAGTYPLITYGSETPGGSWSLSGFIPSGRPGSQTASILDLGGGEIDLSVVGSPTNLFWRGDGSANNWDENTTSNWFNGVSGDVFYDGDLVTFDDSSTNTVVNVATTVQPGSLVVSNNTRNYTFTGASGQIAGPTSLVKRGTGMLLLQDGNGDSFTGGIVVSNGTVIVDNPFTTITGGLTIASGATAQIGNSNDTTGILPSGSVLDNGTLAFNRADSVTVATIVSGTGGISQLGGGTLNLTKANTFAGNIVVSNGILSFNTGAATDGSSGSLGNSSGGGRSVTIASGATLSGTINNWFGGTGLADANFPAITVNGGTMTSTRYTSIGSITLKNGATLTSSGSPESQPSQYQAFQFRGSVIVSGSSGSTISTSATKDDHLNTNTIFNVAVTGGSPDLAVLTGLRNQSGDYGNGPGGFTKMGPGTMLLAAANSYIGNTVISNGVLALNDSGSISNSANIIIANNATLDVSARTDDSLTLSSGQALSGTGSVLGTVSNSVGSTIAPGTSSSIGTLTITNVVDLSGTNVMKLDAGAVTNDLITGAQAINYAGTLTVTNINGTPVANQIFQLFHAASYTGAFAATNLPVLNPGLGWVTTNLSVNGTIQIVSTGVAGPSTNASILSVNLSGTNIVLHGTNNNVPNTSFHYAVLTATNISLPLSNWTSVATNGFNPDGTFNYTNPITPGTPLQFIDTMAVP
jgi:fibronectin-binding autotransporter adhesin